VRGIIRWRSRPPPPIAPEIWALQALDALGTEDWFVRGEQREFYYRLNEIVRRYIELKFSLAAPDMTTQEFLAMLSRRERALPYDADRLRTFLEACDYVKYAAAEPGPDEAASVMATARAFIHATAAVVAESQVTTPTGGQVA